MEEKIEEVSDAKKIQAICFDWGDTVMRVFPQYKGPMANWPKVQVVSGIKTALEELSTRYNLILATNAAASGRELVRKALERVGLETYFSSIFTARELGCRKPESSFYFAVLDQLHLTPENVIFVGDEFLVDVVGAKKIGLWTVWFNPAGNPAPSGNFSPPDEEIRHFGSLLAAIKRIERKRADASRNHPKASL